MIFNRLTGLDIGTAPTYMIPENIKVADAPVRYPFLWNASIQDYTQWPGFSPNGNRLLGLARNIGEVYGVFAQFHPKKAASGLLNMNYIAENSANFAGLNGQEELIMKLAAPKWPFALNKKLAAAGAKVFNKPDPNADNLSCADCHGIKDGEFRSFSEKTWATPIVDVGTDSKEIGLLGYEVKTGVMQGATILPTDEPLKSVDKAISVLARASEGAIIQHYFPIVLTTPGQVGIDLLAQLTADFGTAVSSVEQDLGGFGTLEDLLGFSDGANASADNADATTPSYAYESRVLEGVWAVAPYLHNGSVPTLAELLTPAKDRVATFKIGSAYDIKKRWLSNHTN
ncbi:di-heme-cytochrome C peroxidase [Methylocucumis oryzae]|uniref:di-heme-cytochrome C peroxidase n=1 Tax=Methylocucumis oryzae TaxID=1632867 RepID=UPI000AA0E8EF|nr:di-heme-cytochrome C peroxidase [Methylocucumis oryzae]